ncbi:MAG: hypothetical protein OHK0029_35890 [Armatimonadaceae bacterium]
MGLDMVLRSPPAGRQGRVRVGFKRSMEQGVNPLLQLFFRGHPMGVQLHESRRQFELDILT